MPNSNSKFINFFTYAFPTFIFVVTSQMPANLTIYWFVNNNFTVLIHYVVMQPRIQKILNLPTPTVQLPPGWDANITPNQESKFNRHLLLISF